MLLRFANVEFKDTRVDSDSYAKLKETLLVSPGLPAIKHGDLVLGQSKAIAAYIAKQVRSVLCFVF